MQSKVRDRGNREYLDRDLSWVRYLFWLSAAAVGGFLGAHARADSLVVTGGPSSSVRPILSAMTSGDQGRVTKGEMIYKETEVAGAPWPKIFIVMKVKATPEEIAAVYNGHEEHTKFLPDYLESRVISHPRPHTVRVRSVIDLPWPIANEEYVSETELFQDAGAYEFRWKLLQSDSSDHAEGSLRIEGFADGSLIAYENFVVPNSGLAGLVEGRARDGVVATCRAIKKRAESLRRSDAKHLAKLIENLRKFAAD